MEGLYKRLRREETVTILKRLVEVPEDISNVVDLLFARNLEDCDFLLLKQAFDKLPSSEETKTFDYGQLFFQHFAGLALGDESIRNLFLAQFESLIDSAFQNDIIKSTKDICQALASVNDDMKMQILVPYYKALKASKYKDMFSPYDDIKSVVTEEQWKVICKD